MLTPSTAKSRYGYIITFAGCPILWASRLQTIIALSSTEAEYIALSESLRDFIPLMHIVDKMDDHNIPIKTVSSIIKCKLFEDNAGAIELAKNPKFRPRTKHINIKYHHFREYIANNKIELEYVASKDNPSDMMTKPLGAEDLQRLCQSAFGWPSNATAPQAQKG